MSVASEDYLVRYETDGDDEFAITFPVQLDSSRNAKDIKVYYRNSAGTETDITSLCTISGLTVTTPSAYAATTPASIITIVRWPALLQESTYSRGSNFNPVQFEKDLDRIVYLLQRLNGDINRSFVAPITDGDIDLTLPNVDERPNTVLGFDADGLPISYAGVPAAPATSYMATVLDDETPEEAATTLGVYSKDEVYTQTEMKALYQELAEDKRDLGEMFFIPGDLKTPVAFAWATRRTFFPAKCLDAINIYEDISTANWVSLVPWLRAQKLTYMAGKTSEKYAFDVTNWAISSNVATLAFANTVGENAVLAALLEDKLVHGSYNNYRTVTLASAIGNITAGDYAITDIDTAARTIKFAFMASNNSGSGTFTVNFYHHRIAGSTTTARLFEASGRTLVSAGDASGEEIAGLRRRDRGQGWQSGGVNVTTKYGALAADGNQTGSGGAAAGNSIPYYTTSNQGLATKITAVSDGTNGTPRTGTTTDPRAQVGHLYIHGRDYAA